MAAGTTARATAVAVVAVAKLCCSLLSSAATGGAEGAGAGQLLLQSGRECADTKMLLLLTRIDGACSEHK